MHTIVWIPMVFAAIAAAAVVSALSKREVPADEAEADGVSQQLRAQALFARADAIGLRPASDAAAWAVVMDSAYDGGCVSLVSLADGRTSIYFNSGGGMIGAGDRKSVAAASIAFVRVADSALDLLSPAESSDHPPAGYSRFFVRTDTSLLSAEAREEDLGEGAHPLSPLFYAAHEVIAALRETDVTAGSEVSGPRAVDRR